MLSKVLGGAIGVMLVMLLFLWNQNGSLRDDLATANAGLAQAKTTNKNNVERIDELLGDYNQCVSEREIDEADNIAVVSALKDDLVKAERAASTVRIRTKEIFREPSCQEFGALDINAICPSLARSVRSTANDLSRNPVSRSPGTSPDPDAG